MTAMGRSAGVVLGAGTFCAVLVAGGAALGLHAGNLHNGLIAVSFTAVGLYVVARRPGHREGWLFVATGAAHAVLFAGRQYGLHPGPLPGASWLGWLGVWPLPLTLALVTVTVMGFPDGRLPSPAWRRVVVVLAVAGAALSLVSAAYPVEYARTGLVAPHPLALPGAGAADAFYRVARPVVYLAFQLTWVVSVVVRLHRARGDEASRLRWFVAAVVLTGAVMVVGLVGWGTPLPGVLAVPLVPLAAGAAILRYRLHDLDTAVNRAFVVATMAGVVTLGYAAVVAGVGAVVHGQGTALALLATALVAVVFEPVRQRAQRLADRVVLGHRATPYESLARLSEQLAGPRGRLLDGVCTTVADGVGAREVVLWTGERDDLRAVSAWPAGRALPDGAQRFDDLADTGTGRDAVPVLHDGRFLGALTVRTAPGDPMGAAERRLVGDLAAQAGLILELQGSAQRIVAAGDLARRRLERDLHDGVQQRLVTAALELGGVVRLAATRGDDDLAARAGVARDRLLEATAGLRETARGLHPAVLTQDGLEAALGWLADRSAVPVRLAVDVPRRLPPQVEATAYYVVSEALTNAAKHSGAEVVEVGARLTAEGLELEVADDGRGGAAVRPGSGLEGLADRLRTLDARLGLDSGPAGTRLRTVVPCG